MRVLTFVFVLFMLIACNNQNKKQVVFDAGQDVEQSVINNIYARKSVRQFIADKPVSEEDIDVLMRVGMAGSSGKDQRPWELLVVTDRQILNNLAEVLPHAKMLAHAPMAIIMCGDTVKSNYWYLDCSLGSQNILLAAEAMGLGATWTAAYPYRDRIDAVKSIIDMPTQMLPLNVIPVGYPDGKHNSKNKYDASKVHRNKW